jgi:DNA-binding LytR/AlgR family response regulator
MMEKITCIIVDDNPMDLDYLEQLVLMQPSLTLLHKCDNVIDAKERISLLKPQVLFLDIDMPLLSGIALFKSFDYEPVCVFVTSHSEYAWESYEAMAFDFILKPVMIERFKKVMERVNQYFDIKNKLIDFESGNIEENFIVIKEGYNKHKIKIEDIVYLEALKDYTKIVTVNKKVMVLRNLKQFLEQLPSEKFARVHRSFAVAVDKITKIDQHYIQLNDFAIPVGKTFKQQIKTTI